VGWRTVLRIGALTAGVATLVVTPWLVRNHRVFDGFVFSNNISTVLAGANCDSTYHGRRMGFWDYACLHTDEPRAGPMGETQYNDELRSDAVAYARANASRLPLVGPVRMLRTWAAFRPFEQAQWEAGEGRYAPLQKAAVVVLWILAPLALIGLPNVARRPGGWLVVVLPILATATSALTYGNQRFRTVAEPAVLIMAALGLQIVRRWLRARSSGEPVAGPAGR
jgi:hypothetical protein